jgi:nucleoside-diphosphate-sugar epimerase
MSNRKMYRRRALVTGATGYVGSNLVQRLLAENWTVDVIVRASSQLDVLRSHISSIDVHEHDGSARNMFDLVAKAEPDTVFHTASLFLAQHELDDVESLVNCNLLFATQLVDAMVANGVKRLINTGTSWQHFNNNTYNPVNLYAATKQAFEAILAFYTEAQGLKVTTLVIFDTYGPNDPRPKLVPLLWRAALTQQPLVMSPGDQLVDLVHIEDVICAFILAAEQLPNQQAGHARYGISSGAPMRLKDVVHAFETATETTIPIIWGGREYRSREVMIPWAAFSRLPHWEPKIALTAGIAQTRPRQQKHG